MEPLPPSPPILDAPPWIDLRQYDQSWFDRGRPGWYILIWWLVQSIAFPLSLHNAHGFRCWLLRCFGGKIGKFIHRLNFGFFTHPVQFFDADFHGSLQVVHQIHHPFFCFRFEVL